MERDIFIGVRREDKSYWERRTPLPPAACKEIMDKHPRIQIIVQPSSKRIFGNEEYRKVGALVQEDLSKCELIIGIKEIPLEKFLPNKTYLFWSHTIKAQEQNMPMLDKMLEQKIRHLDYEKILDETGNNITAFPYAGIAGAIDILSEYGKWWLKRGVNNPFLCIGPAYQYFDVEHAYSQLREVGKRIKEFGLPEDLGLPLVIGVLGTTGKCGQGTMETLKQLEGMTIVKPSELADLFKDTKDPKHRYTVYVVPFRTQDLVRCITDENRDFPSSEYYEHPNKFKPVFHERYLPYINILINDIYWSNKFPRYVTNTQMRELAQSGKSRLQAVGDVTCDFEGSIQFLKKFTTPEDPVYYYDPITEDVYDDWNDEKVNQIMYMSIDFLPSQLPYDASISFGKYLVTIAPEIAYSDPTKLLEESGLPKYLQDATITLHGSLTPNFEYIQYLREMNEKMKAHDKVYQPKKALKQVPSYLAIKTEGHLFDKGAINEILNVIEQCNVKFNIVDMKVGSNQHEITSAVIQLYSKYKEHLHDVLEEIQKIGETHDINVSVDF